MPPKKKNKQPNNKGTQQSKSVSPKPEGSEKVEVAEATKTQQQDTNNVLTPTELEISVVGKEDFDKLQVKIKELEKQLEDNKIELETEKTKYQQSIEKHETEIESLKEQNSKLAVDLEERNAKEKEKTNDENSDESNKVKELQEKLEATTKEKEEINQQYQRLFEKISTIRNTLGEKLKADAAELETCKGVIKNLKETSEILKSELISANAKVESLSQDLSTVRMEYQNSIVQWDSKYDNLVGQMRASSEEAEKSKNMCKALEVSLSEEKALLVNLESKSNLLEDQLKNQINYAEQYRKERDESKAVSLTLQNEFESFKTLTNEKEAGLSKQIESLKSALDDAKLETLNDKAKLVELEEVTKNIPELEREVKEKGLQLGKLRHEAVTLNEHLTRALKLIQRSSQGDTVDKELVTNMFLSFLKLPREDTKRFEVLQLIANYLSWDEDQKIQAGISRSGAPTGKAVLMPRVRSEESGGFMSMFADYLEREATRSASK